jgi:hypothetical protein
MKIIMTVGGQYEIASIVCVSAHEVVYAVLPRLENKLTKVCALDYSAVLR